MLSGLELVDPGNGEASGILEPSDDEVLGAPPLAPIAAAGPKPVSEELRRKSWALRSVLKVFVTKVDPNYGQPWQMCPQRMSTGSAFVVDTERRHILTNAHVVSNATAVYVRRPGMARKFKAEVVAEGKVCDLALLTVRDPGFWEGLRALTFVDVPELQASIAVAGYPVGGDSLSVTKGIVSRLALVRYSPAVRLLGIQIDAAINPGNSGGPAFSDLEAGAVAGVAFSKTTGVATDNIGYVIPHRVVAHFLREVESAGAFRGVPSVGFTTQDMENPAQKAYLRVPEGGSGVVVVRVDPLSAAAGVVAVRDVLLEVDGQPVADDGTAVFRDDERLEYMHLVHAKHVGEPLALKIMRDGVVHEVSYPLAVKDHLVPLVHGVDCAPSYLIVGGLVFVPLTSPFLEMLCGGKSRSRRSDIPQPLLAAMVRDKERPGQQVVVLVQVLAHEINQGYRVNVVPCEAFNGVELHNLRHLAALVDACTAPFLNFGLEGGRLVTLERSAAAEHGPSILAVNAIAADRSEDLRRAPKPEETVGVEGVDSGATPAAAPAGPDAAGAAPASAPSS